MQRIPAAGCCHLIFFIVATFCIWGLIEFKQVINPRKLAKAVIGLPCQNWTIDILQPYSPSDYKDCLKWREDLPRYKFYCFQVELSNFEFVHLGECFEEIPHSIDITEDHTVFTKEFTHNPFEISLFITVLICCFLFVTWAVWSLSKSKKNRYEPIKPDSNLVINIEREN